MIYQLLKRDPQWSMAPYFILGCAVAYPLLASSVDRLVFISAMLGFGAIMASSQRATRFQAGLPIAGRQLFLARLISGLASLWLPTLAGSCAILALAGLTHKEAFTGLATVSVLNTLVLSGLQRVRIRELSPPRWLVFAVLIPSSPAALLSVKFLPVAPFVAVCLPMTAVLLLLTWRAIPKSFQLLPAGVRGGGGTVLTEKRHPEETRRFLPAFAWRPVLHSLFSFQLLFFLPYLWLGAVAGQWMLSSFAVAILWVMIRKQCRWLWALPISTRGLLLTILVPLLLALAAGYVFGLSLSRHRPPVPGPDLQILTLAGILGWALLGALSMALFDWRRLARFPKWVRALPGVILVGVPCLVPGGFFVFAPAAAMDQFARLQRDVVQSISTAIPGGAFGAVVVSALAIAGIYWVIEKVFKEAEYTDKPRAPRDFEFVQG